MVREFITLEGHIIDSDILRRVFSRIVEDGGEFEVVEFTRRQAQRRPVVRAPRGHGRTIPHVLDTILEDLSYLGASAVVDDAAFAPAEADGILPDEFYSTTNFDTFVRIDGTWVPGGRRRRWTARSCCATGAPDCVKQGRVRAGRAGGAARPRHPRAAARAQPRATRCSASCRTTSRPRSTRASPSRARRARCGARARPARRSCSSPGPPSSTPAATCALARLVREGWIDVAAHRQRLRRARHGEVDPQDEPRRLPDERPRRRGRQPQPPLRDQRRQPRGGIRQAVEAGRRHVGRDVRVRAHGRSRSCSPARSATTARSAT